MSGTRFSSQMTKELYEQASHWGWPIPQNMQAFVDLAKECPTLKPNTRKQILIQFKKICLSPLSPAIFSHSFERDDFDDSGFADAYKMQEDLFKLHGASQPTIKMFYTMLLMVLELIDWRIAAKSIHKKNLYEAMELIKHRAFQLDLQINEEALTRKVDVLSQEELYQRICDTFMRGTLERTLLTLYTFLPLRDDTAYMKLVKIDRHPTPFLDQLKRDHPGSNLLLDEYKENRYWILLQKTKTVGKHYDSILTSPFNERCIQAMNDYLLIHPCADGHYVFGTVKRSQNLISWMSEMDIRMRIEADDGSVTDRGAGVDYFRCVNRAAAQAQKNKVVEATVARMAGHSALTAQKYNASISTKII